MSQVSFSSTDDSALSPRSKAASDSSSAYLIDFSSRDLINFGDIGLVSQLERIEQHSREFTKVSRSVWLLLHNNSLSDISFLFSFDFLAHVTVLSLYDNNLSSLPDLAPLKALEVLSARKNQLETIPPSVGGLQNLGWLYLQSNCITHLPCELGLCARLQLIDLADNPLDGRNGSLSALVKDSASATRLVVDFCRSRLEESQSSLPTFRERTLSIGQPSLGTTSKSKSVQNLKDSSKVEPREDRRVREDRGPKKSSSRGTVGAKSGVKLKAPTQLSKEEQIEFAMTHWLSAKK